MVDVNKCCMTRFPAEVLGEVAKPVGEITEDIVQLVEKMKDLMVENKGIGLAGPQAGVGLRLFVVSVDGTKENAKVYINPTIEVAGLAISHEEGCLSLPEIYGNVKRYPKCKITATDIDGNEFTEVGEELLSCALQHEYDHLEGTLIKDKFGRIHTIRARRGIKKLMDEA
jgi:peptide deformylase